MNLKDRMIIDSYRLRRDDYVKLGDIVHEKLEEIVEEARIPIMVVTHRVKTERSLAGKLELRGQGFHTLEEIHDILGARVICYFNDDVARVGKLIEETFVIVEAYDKGEELSEDSFGYRSMHYNASLKPEPQYPQNLCNIIFEIQVRTNLQHTWAEIEHDFKYKSEFTAPSSVTRSFSRIAGLLELADDEFVRTRDNMTDYLEQTRRRIRDGEADALEINSVSLDEYMKEAKEMQEFIRELTSQSGTELLRVSSEGYVIILHRLGIRTLGEFRKMLEQNREDALQMARQALAGDALDMITSTAILRYLCRVEILRRGYTEDEITSLLKDLFDSEEKARKTARFILRRQLPGKEAAQ